VILAAGDGTRLAPLTSHCPKPLIRVLDRPLLDYTLASFVASGIRDLIIVVGYRAEEIRAWVGDGQRYGARVSYVFNPDYERENALSLRAAQVAVGEQPFVLSMADNLTSADILRTLLRRRVCADTLCVDRRARYAPQLNDATRVWVNRRGAITRIGKGLTRWNAVDTGVFFFTPRIFEAIDALQAAGNSNPNISQSVTRLIEAGEGLHACDVSGLWWTDVDTLEDLRNVEAELAQREALESIEELAA
jgi:choline kinase